MTKACLLIWKLGINNWIESGQEEPFEKLEWYKQKRDWPVALGIVCRLVGYLNISEPNVQAPSWQLQFLFSVYLC